MGPLTDAPESHSIKNGNAASSNRPRHSTRSTCAQILATLIQNWLLIEIGLDIAMTTMVIGALHNSASEELSMNDDQASWFGSLPDICHPVSSLLSGYVQEAVGRKTAMIMVTIPCFVAWITLHFAQSINTLYIVSIIMGLCTGLTEAPLHSYIGEIAEPHLRGTLSSISTSAALIGMFMMYVFTYFFYWRTVALICSACPVITFTVMTQIPESPTWLVVRNRLDEAKKALCWLRGWVKPAEVEEEFQALVKHAEKSVGLNQAGDDKPRTKIAFLKMQLTEMTRRKVLLPFRQICIVFFICSLAYFCAIRPYLIGELQKLDTPIDAKLILIYSQVLLFIGAMMNVMFLRRFGKRKIAIFCNTVIAISMFGLGIHYAYLKGSKQFPLLAWLPVVFWLSISFFGGFGPALLAWQLVSELFPIIGRGLATGISAAFSKLMGAAEVKSYLYIEAWVDLSGVMYLYGTATILGTLYLYFYLPETEGKSLEQIEVYFTENYDRKEKFSIGKRVKLEEKNPS
ncbi:unnamed protein product [Bemisia tabaci]|uniref:Major facilitator superfamily (MFS) profile domain-containing protein n=1 Tax=Bemisia tabaci TaxID=7038 RepID=A0A9N9ZZE3_BEMTA|nr:unnamed protein product [Bemisia tabaci]